jgi:hypothetical protein
MIPESKYSKLVRMLEAFVEGRGQTRGTITVREIEGEFARLGLDEEEEFSDLQHAFAMYRGHEADIRHLKTLATVTIRRLATRYKRPNQGVQ